MVPNWSAVKSKVRIIKRIFYTFLGMFALVFVSFAKAKIMNEFKVGDIAPKISAKNQEGQLVDIEYGSGYTLVYFYPKADTPGCTAQACSLRDAYAELTKKGVTIYGVSADTPEEQKKFKEKYHLPFELLADTDKKVMQAFGVPTRMGFASRQAFLIKDGKFVWIDRSASTVKQAEDVLNFINKNN